MFHQRKQIEMNFFLFQMNSRVRTQKKIYTPTGTNGPDSFLCKVIETGEFIIVHRSSVKRLYDDTAEIMMNGQRTEAKIEHRGLFNLKG